jgi:calpain-15|tara:strand:+ start:457 stop:786 length:330 start_codon:yes stop_codon:yes gene_type:complete
MSALTENPERVRKLFVNENITSEGIYGLNVTKNGVKTQVVLDDHIPCSDGDPCFSSANGNELWVLLLEKCWAKLHGSYARIIGGQSHLTFRDLTGAPSFEQETSAEDAW